MSQTLHCNIMPPGAVALQRPKARQGTLAEGAHDIAAADEGRARGVAHRSWHGSRTALRQLRPSQEGWPSDWSRRPAQPSPPERDQRSATGTARAHTQHLHKAPTVALSSASSDSSSVNSAAVTAASSSSVVSAEISFIAFHHSVGLRRASPPAMPAIPLHARDAHDDATHSRLSRHRLREISGQLPARHGKKNISLPPAQQCCRIFTDRSPPPALYFGQPGTPPDG